MSEPHHKPDTNTSIKPTNKHAYTIFRNWVWEIVSVAVAIGLIVAIAVLLATHDGKPAPDWGERINLNALLATLSTILRAMLVVVVSQIISQRKWEWFDAIRERPLIDLQKFDSGSRGVLGAIQLLPTVLWRDPITFTAAIILFTSFLVGPFVQQASRTSECTFVATNLKASLPFAHYVPRRGGYVSDAERDDLGVPAPDLITTILSAVTAPGSVENRIRGSCSSGNCTFPTGDPAYSESSVAGDKDSVTHSTVAMCNKCTDISSLVVRENVTCGYPVLSLPNNMSVSRGCGGREVVRMQPNSNLSWMGDLLTPELRSFARWAYVNASIIGLNSYANETNAAVMCSLYPCVQTYTAFISGSEVSETKVGSKVMQLDMLWNAHVPEQGDHNALDDIYQSYTAIQSPCRAQGEVHDLYGNISAGVNGTELALYDFTDYGYPGTAQSTLVNITVPKECIYRQNPQFVKAVSRLLNYEVFSGSCSAIKTFNCRKAGSPAPDDKFLPGLGAETVLRALYGESYKSPSNLTTGLSNVTEWFDLFAEAMTRRFRTEYGSADEGDYRERDSPLDEIQGLAWQMTTCVSMRRVWLILPISLTVITAALAIWTIVTNWRHRHSRPVWKDSIFPFMFYGHDMVDGVLDRCNPDSSEQPSPGQKMNQVKEKNNPLENKRMKEISNSTAVTCSWLCAIDNSDGTPALTKRTCWSRKSTSDIQLLDTYENIEARSGICGDQAVPMVAEPREDNQTLEVAQVDGDAQTPAVTQTHEREEAEPQQSQLMHLQACAYDREGADDDADAHET